MTSTDSIGARPARIFPQENSNSLMVSPGRDLPGDISLLDAFGEACDCTTKKAPDFEGLLNNNHCVGLAGADAPQAPFQIIYLAAESFGQAIPELREVFTYPWDLVEPSIHIDA